MKWSRSSSVRLKNLCTLTTFLWARSSTTMLSLLMVASSLGLKIPTRSFSPSFLKSMMVECFSTMGVAEVEVDAAGAEIRS
ncbi:hypothetical protein BDY19DRAFT_927032 [Irpex rosettiformis]|uniref:Uncharacterized protein n=1 Tax=Irpex rosettiformis TaxID=378272 RepID=A0ACB8UC93_9APHY|nr:hypothetical protein BDY19DRAFT_927032 [Irpex rosettiformis]